MYDVIIVPPNRCAFAATQSPSIFTYVFVCIHNCRHPTWSNVALSQPASAATSSAIVVALSLLSCAQCALDSGEIGAPDTQCTFIHLFSLYSDWVDDAVFALQWPQNTFHIQSLLRDWCILLHFNTLSHRPIEIARAHHRSRGHMDQRPLRQNSFKKQCKIKQILLWSEWLLDLSETNVHFGRRGAAVAAWAVRAIELQHCMRQKHCSKFKYINIICAWRA